MKVMKKYVALLSALVVMCCPAMVAYAHDNPAMNPGDVIMNVALNKEIGFILYKASDSNDEVTNLGSLDTKKYTSDSYSGYFYYTNNNNKISEHTFTAKFSYSGSVATCYETSNSIVMIDNDTNLRPKAENEGRNNLTPTQVYGYISFVLYNTDDSVNSEVTIKIYCNQNGETWVNRQG